MRQTRQLAAIMFTDIVGYTALMGEDELKAFQILDRNRELQTPIIQQFNGSIIKELGDGILASFTTVSDAVQAAIKIRESCNQDFQLRIGIHHGEIVYQGNDVFGDAVNIASRLQAIAPVGGIYVSESVHHNVVNKKDISTRFVKTEKLKNVAEPVRIYEVTLKTDLSRQKPRSRHRITEKLRKIPFRTLLLSIAVIILLSLGLVYLFNGGKGFFGNTRIQSIAVMPFVNESGLTDMEYLSDGMTETLINSLSKLKNLSVKARSSVFRYKGKEVDSRKIGDELAVEAILNGRVTQRVDDIILNLELVDVKTGNQLWGEQYKRKTTDLVLLQSEIARDVSDKLKAKLSGAEEKTVTENYTHNAQAYQHYLKGRFYWNKRTTEALKKASEEFQKAITYDPNYAIAYSGLADCYSSMQALGAPANQVGPLARAAAERAIQLDNSLAEAHASMGMVYQQGWQWSEAERELKRSIELNPRYASAYHWYSILLEVMGKPREALQIMMRAQELDPVSPIISLNVARLYFMAGQLDSAFTESQKLIQLNPEFDGGYNILALVYQTKGEYKNAISILHKAAELTNREGNHTLMILGYIYGMAGARSDALAVAGELEKKYINQQAKAVFVAAVYLGLGEKQKAVEWLEKDYRERNGLMPILISGFPFFNSLSTDPRYKNLRQRMGLPEN
jgi:TolB-like protein/class 3 adenylate cyclase/Tfp pilus assembly protein PilF